VEKSVMSEPRCVQCGYPCEFRNKLKRKSKVSLYLCDECRREFGVASAKKVYGQRERTLTAWERPLTALGEEDVRVIEGKESDDD
jgi:hypothetical protein